MGIKDELDFNGHVVLRAIHDKPLIAAIQSDALDELCGLGISDGSFEEGQPRFIKGTDENVAQAASMPTLRRSKYLHALTGSKQIQSLLTALFDEEVFVHPNRWVRAVPPDSEEWSIAPSIHADCFEIQGSMRQVTMWSPIFPVSASTGGLPVYSTTNGNQIPEGLRLSSDNPSGWTLDPATLGMKSVHALSPGDALLFCATTPQGGSVNAGDGWRVSVETRFQPFCDPICDNALQPYDGSTWEKALPTRTFSEAVGITRHPVVMQFDRVWEDWRAIEALKLGAQGNPDAIQALVNAQLHPNSFVRRRARQLLEDNAWCL